MPPADAPSSDGETSSIANSFLITLAGAVTQAQLYEPDNKILKAPMDRLTALLGSLLTHSAIFTFQGRDQSIFVNDVRLRTDAATFVRHQDFLKQLELRKISGVTFSSELSTEEWRTFLYTLARCDRKSPKVFAEIRFTLVTQGVGKKVTLLPIMGVDAGTGDWSDLSTGAPRPPPAGPQAGGAPSPGTGGSASGSGAGASSKGTGGSAPASGAAASPNPQTPVAVEVGKKAQARRLKMDRRLFAVRSYAKAILTFREYVEGLRDPARGSQVHLRLQRSILELVTMCEEIGWKYIGLVNNKGFDEYLYNHSVNVTVLSLILGLHLRLARPRLSELGMAAMLHHLGKARLPQEVMEKQGVLTEEERKLIASHSSLGIHELLRSRQYNESLLKRIMVMAEHHESHSVQSNTHPFSRIVAIAEAFDALTTTRPYRPAHLPDVAIGLLSKMAGDRLDRDLTLAFIQSIGVYPSGTVVELSDQSIGVVSHPSKDPKAWKTPHVRLIRSPSYQEILSGPVIDLSQPVEGKPAPEIVRTLEPGHLGINPAGYLFMEPPKRSVGF